ncbi:MAG TPA: hypothetical protein VG826_29290 [Pirellulales bacterium]|nr:hypothetical protein [Pirellulales bacterium]
MREVTKFNLIYHLYPVDTRSVTRLDLVWRWHASQLLDRLHLFSGRRIVAVALDHQTVPLERVAEVFGDRVELVPFQNDPKLGEVATLVPLLERVESTDPGEASFYAHSKGVSRRGDELAQVLCWADCLYHHLLDFPTPRAWLDVCAMYGVGFSCDPLFRYPGTFWWFNHARLFGGDRWRRPRNVVTADGDRWAAESFPELCFPRGGYLRKLVPLSPYPVYPGRLYAAEVWHPSASREAAECSRRARARWQRVAERVSPGLRAQQSLQD